MFEWILYAVKAPLQVGATWAEVGAALLGAGAATGFYFSRKKLRRLRRKALWQGLKQRFRRGRQPPPVLLAAGCLVIILLLVMVVVLAIFIWPLALALLVIVGLIWLIKQIDKA